MSAPPSSQDAVIIGGGFYGAMVAIYLAKERGLKRVLLVEQESELFARASSNNQARVHAGYHYPRSFTTAYRSRVNLSKFMYDWSNAVSQDFIKIYAIARNSSKVTARQFIRFCREIGATIQPVDQSLRKLFVKRNIEDAFMVEEYAFNCRKLASWAKRALHDCGVQVCLQTRATEILKTENKLLARMQTNHHAGELISCSYVFNWSYAGINQIMGAFSGTKTSLKQEVTEIAMIEVPPQLRHLGITVIDGPFFSLMPHPAQELHALSHVRYTPHIHWIDRQGIDPYQKLTQYEQETRADRMIRDVAKYVPAITDAKYVGSVFEIKTVLSKSEGDDSRPILFEKHQELPGCYSILGGKIDNIYDILEKLETEEFVSPL
jgi:glycine/D-amino acid oxidase-like deaminating enzyme